MTHVKRQIVSTSITRHYQHVRLTILYYYHSQSQQETKILIALPRVTTKAAQNGFLCQGAMIYNS